MWGASKVTELVERRTFNSIHHDVSCQSYGQHVKAGIFLQGLLTLHPQR